MIALLGVLAFFAVGGASAQGEVGATMRCADRSFVVAFDPARSVVVTSGGRRIASATFASRSLHGCSRSRWILGSDDLLQRRGVYRPVTLRCTLARAVQVHVHPIVDDSGRRIGSALSLASGANVDTAVAAVLKNRGDPNASRIYYARRYCTKLR